MSEKPSSRETVLIVDDEKDLTDLYAAWLEDTYEVRTAYNAEEALDRIDETVNIVLLDRRMTGGSGDQVLAELRDRGYDCPVAMVTAVGPDLELAELGFNDYVEKPVDKADLINVIEILRLRASYSGQIERYTALLTKKVLLDREVSEDKRKTSEAYNKLQIEVKQAREAADDSLSRLLESDDIDELFRDIKPREHV